MPYYKVEGIGGFMLLLRAVILALGVLPLPVLAQDAAQLFQPAPSRPAPASDSIPMVRAALDTPPVPTARPTPEIRSTESDTETPPTPSPRPPVTYEPQKVAFADGVSAQFDISYASLAGFRPLTLDIYTPRPRPGPLLPMVLYVHGGGWNSGDSRHAPAFGDFPRALAGLAAQGYVVASLNYRLSQEAHFPAALQDVKAAIRWLRGHAGAYSGDPTRLAVWGMSAGGQLAAMAGATCGVMHFEPEGNVGYDAPSDCAEAVIDWFGPTDLENLADDNGKPGKDGFVATGAKTDEGSYLGCEPAACAPGVVKLASPQAFVSESTPPFLIQHGAADTSVSPKQSQRLYDMLKKKGVPAEIVLYPDAGHDFLKDGSPDTATVTKAMAKLTAFLIASFPNKPAKPSAHYPVANPSHG
jgi:acetyl esterase/lipase